MFIVAIYLMPVSIAAVLVHTSPIMTSIFSFLVLGEKLSVFDLIGIFVSLIGVIIISNPDLIVSFFDKNVGETIISKKEYPYFTYGVISGILGSMSAGLAYLWMRKIGKKVNASLLPMYFGIISLFTSAIVLIILEFLPSD